jgi:hypothetical protein
MKFRGNLQPTKEQIHTHVQTKEGEKTVQEFEALSSPSCFYRTSNDLIHACITRKIRTKLCWTNLTAGSSHFLCTQQNKNHIDKTIHVSVFSP